MILTCPPSATSQAQPLPNWPTAAVLNCSLNLSKLPQPRSIAWATCPLGEPRPFESHGDHPALCERGQSNNTGSGTTFRQADRLSPVAALVRRHDRDRYQTVLFAPAARREALFALYAFNYEIARVRETVTQPM